MQRDDWVFEFLANRHAGLPPEGESAGEGGAEQLRSTVSTAVAGRHDNVAADGEGERDGGVSVAAGVGCDEQRDRPGPSCSRNNMLELRKTKDP